MTPEELRKLTAESQRLEQLASQQTGIAPVLGGQTAIVPATDPITSAMVAPVPTIELPEEQPENDYRYDTQGLTALINQFSTASTSETATTQTELGKRILELTQMTGEGEKGAFEAEQDQAFGVTEKSNQIRSLVAQINSLGLEAAAVPEMIQAESVGRGRTTGGVAPLQAAKLRENYLKSNALAQQALVLQGDLVNAKDLADRAVKARFEKAENDLEYLKEAYKINKDILDREDKQRSEALGFLIKERTRLLDNAKENMSVAQGLANTAIKNYAGDQAVALAARQVFQLDPEDPDYLFKVHELVGQYQGDPNRMSQDLADLEYKQAQTASLKAETARKWREINAPPGADEQLYAGLSSPTATAVRQRVTKFSSEPIVQNFATIQEGRNFATSISDTTTNPADDQALIYALAKALDPGSVVREGEYATAQKYSQSWVSAYGKGVEQALLGTGFLSQEARKNIKKTIEQKYQASKNSYDNIYKQYSSGINQLTGRRDGTRFLTDYAIPTTTSNPFAKLLMEKGRVYEADGKTFVKHGDGLYYEL